MSNIIQSQPEVKEVPSFLKEAALTKPDPDAKHHEKLIEIANGFDIEDASIVCQIFARKYPTLMLKALSTEMDDLRALRDDVTKTIDIYKSKEDAI